MFAIVMHLRFSCLNSGGRDPPYRTLQTDFAPTSETCKNMLANGAYVLVFVSKLESFMAQTYTSLSIYTHRHICLYRDALFKECLY